jgi:hypothetical protein
MKQRCYNPKSTAYKSYGARGVYICQQWLDHSGAFIVWALMHGWKPGLTIDRINNDGPYSPENCRFVSRAINVRNSRTTKLKESDVMEIIKRLNAGESQTAIAKDYRVNSSLVCNISQKRIWKNIPRRSNVQ